MVMHTRFSFCLFPSVVLTLPLLLKVSGFMLVLAVEGTLQQADNIWSSLPGEIRCSFDSFFFSFLLPFFLTNQAQGAPRKLSQEQQEMRLSGKATN